MAKQAAPRSVDLSLDEWNDFPWHWATCLFAIIVYVRS